MMKPKFLSVYLLLALCVALTPTATLSKSQGAKKGKRAVAQKSSRTKSNARITKNSRSQSARVARTGKGKNRYSRKARNRRTTVQARRPNQTDYQTNEALSAQTTPAAFVPRSASGIPSERVAEIQSALVKSGHLNSELATGFYDQNTIEAMRRFQSKNSLPQTGMPSAFTLKRLGVAKSANNGYSIPVIRNKSSEKKVGLVQPASPEKENQ